MPASDAALLLLGHGSTVNADSSAPTYQHAEEIGRRRLFAEVCVGFWKEEPNFRQALRQTQRRRVYVVPNFISSGYFTEQIVPRELGLEGEITRRENQEIIYCEPVGLHPSMTEALLRRAREVVAASGETIENAAATTCLFICGHGTSFNDNSTRIIHDQAAIIRARGLYADCQPVLMEQAPFVRDWRTLTACRDVIVVPFFISDGLHSFEDIPRLLGLEGGRSARSSHREGDRRLWYAPAIGTEKFIADVILAQVEQARRKYPEAGAEELSSPVTKALRDFFAKTSPPWKMGQAVIKPGFVLLHEKDDENDTALARLQTLSELREWILLDGEGCFRPLRAAPNLRRGWIYRASSVEEVHAALDYLYPAELANEWLWREGKLPVTPWRETAERQSGRFRIVRELPAPEVLDLVGHYCERGCLKTRLWAPAAESVNVQPGQLPLLCPEACNFLVAKAREKLKGEE
jgi:sirohydrochlorin cobaltochelatase